MYVRRPNLVILGSLTVGAALAGSSACDDPSAVRDVSVDSAVVLSAGVVPDPARTYEYDRASVRPDSALAALWRAGLPVEVAWRPLHYRCLDPRGARLTVELTAPDPRMADYDFSLGTGRLPCSEDLVRYTVSWGEG